VEVADIGGGAARALGKASVTALATKRKGAVLLVLAVVLAIAGSGLLAGFATLGCLLIGQH